MSSTQLVITYLLAMLGLRYALRLRSIPSAATSSISSSQIISRLRSTANPSDQSLLDVLQSHQSKAQTISKAEEVRTLVAQSTGYGTLTTNSVQYPGFPVGSVVGFALDDRGLPIASFSTLSAHTRELMADGRMSLVVTEKDFKDASNGRVSLIGVMKQVEGEEAEKLKAIYMKKHPSAFWVNFGDFSMFAMEALEAVRYVGGFARAGTITAEEYLNAKPDPLHSFTTPVMKHMNDDHEKDTIAIIQHFVGVPCSNAKITSIDRLGMRVNVKLGFGEQEEMTIRVPFIREAADRKGLKDVLVDMTRTAQLAQSS